MCCTAAKLRTEGQGTNRTTAQRTVPGILRWLRSCREGNEAVGESPKVARTPREVTRPTTLPTNRRAFCCRPGLRPDATEFGRCRLAFEISSVIGFKVLRTATAMGCGAWLLCASALAAEPQVVVTGQMELEFRDGWLTRWRNKLTDEEIRFGAGPTIPEARGSEFLKADETTAALTQAGATVWAMSAPHDRAAVVHGEAGAMRQRYLLIQAGKSGLLVMLDDPQQACRASLERTEARQTSTLTFRATVAAPDQGPARWLIRQYVGGANWGAQHRLNYLTHTYTITAPDKRPTAWLQNISLVVADPPWCSAVTGLGWGRSLEVHHAWLDNLQRIADPEKVLFCARNWCTAAGGPAPYAVLMAGRARRLGYHVALRIPLLANNPQRPEEQRLDNEAWQHAKVGEILAAVCATDADAVLLEDSPAEALAGGSQFIQLLRSELDQRGLTMVALGVEGEPAEAALPCLDFFGGTDGALATLKRGSPVRATPATPHDLLRGDAPLQTQIELEALLTDEERQAFGLALPAPAKPFTRLQFGLFALARFWGENQPRVLEPKYFEAGDLLRYRLNNDRILRLVSTAPDTLRLAYENGEVLTELTKAGWLNNAALLDQHSPVFLKDKTEP